MITVGQIREIVKHLDGKKYASRDDMDSAVLPCFSGLQSVFPGQTFRDFTDMLIRKGWIVFDRHDGFTVKLPSETQAAATAQGVTETPITKADLSMREIAMLVYLNTHTFSRQTNGKPNPNYDSLIVKGLVEYTDVDEELSPDERKAIQDRLVETKGQVISAIVSGDYPKAKTLCSTCEDTADLLVNGEMTYRLTSKGRVFMDEHPDSTNGIKNG